MATREQGRRYAEGDGGRGHSRNMGVGGLLDKKASHFHATAAQVLSLLIDAQYLLIQ